MIALILVAAFVLYLVAAIFVTRWLVKRASSEKAKWVTGLVSALMFFLIPTWDHILGAIYFRHLCASEGGIKVYKTVELGPDYYLKPGEIDFNTAGRLHARGGELDHKKLKERFSITTSSQDISRYLRIQKDMLLVKDPVEGKILATEATFFHFGGWFTNNFSPHPMGTHCPHSADYYQRFYDAIFKRIH